MKNIKFKVWNKEKKIMFTHIEFTEKNDLWLTLNGDIYKVSDGNRYAISPADYIILQYTGLKDKNDTEICEGDILKADGMRMVVIWKEDIACFGVQAQGWIYTHYFGEGVDNVTSEIIGNIYENHELIEYKHA